MTSITKAVILAGGRGSRLFPITQSISKQLLPVFDKPIIYYSISFLIEAGIKDIAIICCPHDMERYDRLLGDGRQWGCQITMLAQNTPRGVGEAPMIARDFLQGQPFVLYLGDNFFHGGMVTASLKKALNNPQGANIFTIPTPNPEQFGVAQIDSKGCVFALEEKPIAPKSNLAVTGLYVFDQNAIDLAEWLIPSDRGELEIVDLLKLYLNQGLLSATELPSGTTWSDLGTQHSLFDAANFVQKHQDKVQTPIGSPEYSALSNGLIDYNKYVRLALALKKTDYGKFLLQQVQQRSKRPAATA